MSTKTNNNRLPSNLPQLQNLIKRDSESYHEEFERQYAVYKATKAIFEQNPTINNNSLHELVMFFAQIAHCYTEDLKDFPEDLVNILQRHGSSLHPNMRLTFVKALVLLRNKNLLSPTALLSLFFRLLRSEDKNLRTFLREHITTDIKNINAKGKNMKLNKELQNFMFEMLKDNHAVAIKTSLDVMIELYRKQVWNDAKTVNIIASACFCKITKVMVAALKFFIGTDEEQEESESESEDDLPSLKQVRLAARVNKRKNKANKKEEKVKEALKNRKKKKKKKDQFDFSAIHLVHDPQNMAEKLYKKLNKMNERFEVRLMLMNLISRLVGIHELYLPNIYPFLQRFLFVHQRDVTKIMTYAAQASHPLVPPEDLEPVVKTLANNFVTERYSGEVMAMGINAIRELCARNAYCIDEDLLQDLAAYRGHKDKAVSMASRSLISLFREKNPQLLARKDRGAPTELIKETQVHLFGENDAKEFIPGAEVLTFLPQGENAVKRGQNDDSDSDSWEDVSHDESDEDEQNSEADESQSGYDGKPLNKKEAIREIMKLTPSERAERAKEVMMTRTFTDEDFSRIEAAQAAKQVERFSAGRKNKRKRQSEKEPEEGDRGEIVKLSSIEMVHKKRRHDRQERLRTVLEGREGREKFGSRKGRLNPNASTTNKEKIKGKTFMMMKHKIRSGRKKLSFRDRQIKLRDGLLKSKLS